MDPNPNPSSNLQPPVSSPSSPNPQTLDPSPNSTEAKESPPPNVGSSQDAKDPNPGEKGEGEEEEEEEAECGFCLFMKAGGCKDQFVAWEKCVEDAEKNEDDIAEKCFEVTSLLKKCMDAHADYYEPILSAEKAMVDSIAEDNEKEKEEAQEKSEVTKAEAVSVNKVEN